MKTSFILNHRIARKVAAELLKIEAVKLSIDDPFTWVSGIRSPVYCDNRKINSHVSSRQIVADAFVKVIKNNFGQLDSIAGVATGGIPMGILIADRMDLPFIYVRQEAKKYGLMKQVEGDYKEGDKTVLIEDLVSTGGSSLKAYNGIVNANVEVESLLSIMTYNFKSSKSVFSDNNVNYSSLTDLDVLLEVAKDEGRLSDDEVNEVLKFRDDPKSWR
ncbi:orotate phosphoribosyltransferase [Portibacter marinus]|uniref:orotate phosphoribosyltransferase n=1 Tax=Portibacter marinus TaxID=2898660 RepID=UPI001F457B32|nr:orotate phosphoribosyltransferase [Portibacter marinus]